MKAQVIREFRDKDDFAKVYEVNSIIDLPAERIKDLIGLELVVEIEVNQKTTQKRRKNDNS